MKTIKPLVQKFFTASCSIALAVLLVPSVQQANAQGCATGLGSSIQLDKTLAHIGDTVTVTLTRVSTAQGDCNITGLVGWIVFPNNAAALNMTNVTLTSPQTFSCTGPSGGSCVSGVNYSYVIQAADVGRNLSFDTPQGNSCVRAGSANTVRFLFAAEGTAQTAPVTSTAFACNNAPITIITPGIACTKSCSNGVGENGQITFSGSVTNTGNTILNNVIVSNLVNGTLTLVTTIPTLNPGQSAPFSGSYVPANPCVPTQDTIFVRGTDNLGLTVTSQCTATCTTVLTPCIVVTKDCNTVPIGQPNTVSGIVTNCGNVTITNIQVTDNLYGAITTIASLAPGASASYSKLVTNVTCGNFPNTVTAAGTTRCGQPIQDTDNDVCVVLCAPKICVTKEVVCELPTGCATNWSDLAVGVKSGNDCPSFCYRIRVTNCGQEALNNVTVTDNRLDISGCNFPPTLAVGQTVECIVAGVEHCTGVTNTVTASGVGAISGTPVSTNDIAGVIVREIDLTCELFVNGQPSIEIPCDQQPYLVTNTIRVCNTGQLPIVGSIFAPYLVALGGDCANVTNIQVSLDPGQCAVYTLCIDAVTCPPDCSLAFSNYVKVIATVDLGKTNVCAWTRNASNAVVQITAETECIAVVECLPLPKAGCTPGFWKNCTIHWQLTGYSTGQSVSSVFTFGNCCTGLGNSSLLAALDFGGGSDVCGAARNLLRAAVAAVLNASSPEVDYPFTTQQVIASVNAALQSCDRATMLALASELDRNNNLGCEDANGNELPCKRLSTVLRTVPNR